MNNKVLSLISLSMKAGKVKSGELASEESIKNHEAYLVIIAADASDNTKKKFINSSNYYKLPYVIIESKDSLGQTIGKEYRSVITICDEGFAKSILSKLSV